MELDEEVKAKITLPKDESTVPYRITFEGTHQNIPPNMELWLVAMTEQTMEGTEETFNIFYPQGAPLLRLPGGNWHSVMSVGFDERESIGQTYQILLVATRGGATKQLTKYAHESAARGHWSGMLRLPGSATVLDSVTLIRS
jgi:hypothetical protein